MSLYSLLLHCFSLCMFQLAFGLAMVLDITKDMKFGVLCTPCVPGGRGFGQ